MDNAQPTTQEQPQVETPVVDAPAAVVDVPQTDLESTPAQTETPAVDSQPETQAEVNTPTETTVEQPAQPEIPAEQPASEEVKASPVTIGSVTVTAPITSADVLKSAGVVEITNPDGSKSQYSIEQAQARVAEAQALVEQLGGSQ